LTGAAIAIGVYVAPVTVPSPWGSSSAPIGVTSSVQTVTVPPNNAGVLTLTPGGTYAVMSYKKNGGMAFSFIAPTNVTFANGDTLQLLMGGASGNIGTVAVMDATTGLSVGGTWTGNT
jgi:hypothetical protein